MKEIVNAYETVYILVTQLAYEAATGTKNSVRLI